MRMTLILMAVVTVCYGEKMCSENTIPDLNGAWVCNKNWLLDTKEDLPYYEGSKRWIFYYELPKFYAISKIRTIPSCVESFVLRLSASVWDERFDKKEGAVLDKAPVSRWISVEVPVVEFIGNTSTQEYSGFARRAPYWRLEVDMMDMEGPCRPKFIFFAKAGMAAMQTFVFDMEFPSERTVDLEDSSNAPIENTCQRVTGIPSNAVSRYRLDTSFYRKYTSAYGIPVMSSRAVDDRALQRACYVVRFMLADRKDLRDHMYRNKGRVAIIGRRETVPMVPEMRQYTWWTRRAAGGTFQNPVNVGAEENMLCERGDGYARDQDIFMHEFAHGIHLIACYTAIRNFNARLQQSFNSARSRGLWTNTYANTDNREYFAEGVQAFFEQQREGPYGGDGIQNHINTREELRRHDPTLYKIIDELFPCYNDYIPRCNDIGQTQGLGQNLKLNCNGGTGITIKPTATSTANPGVCLDDNESCAYWAGIGECEKNPDYMLVTCKKSCATCATPTGTGITIKPTATSTANPGVCLDDNESCAYWAGIGECEKNPDYMLVTCKKSCATCATPTVATTTTDTSTTSTATPTATSTTATTTTTETSTTSATTTAAPEACEDDHPNCQYWEQIGECDKNPDYMKLKCRESCGECSGTKTCNDSDANCIQWGSYCSTNQYVIQNCRETCGLC